MDDPIEDFTLIGKSVLRREDSYLLRGRAQFLDDLPEPGNLIHLAFVASPHARADILSIDASAALALPGVIAVLTGKDFVDSIKPFAPDIEIGGYREVRRPVVAVDRVNQDLSVIEKVRQFAFADEPFSICQSTSLRNAGSSNAPSRNGVTRAGMEPENMDFAPAYAP